MLGEGEGMLTHICFAVGQGVEARPGRLAGAARNWNNVC